MLVGDDSKAEESLIACCEELGKKKEKTEEKWDPRESSDKTGAAVEFKVPPLKLLLLKMLENQGEEEFAEGLKARKIVKAIKAKMKP